MKTDIREGNKLIAEFDGLVKLSEKESGILQTSELLYKNKEGEYISHAQLKYHSSWDRQIPAWVKFLSLSKIVLKKSKENAPIIAASIVHFQSSYEKMIHKDDVEKGFEILYEALQWYNQNKEK